MQIYLDGEFVAEEEAKLSVFDHGLLYGDGVFEGIRAYNGRVFELEGHIKRLYDSAKAIALDIPMSRTDMIETVSMETECLRASAPITAGCSSWRGTLSAFMTPPRP